MELRRTGMVVMIAAVAWTAPIASATDEVRGRVAVRTIVLQDDDIITPSAITMHPRDVLEFENDSGRLMKLVFMEPHDQSDKIRCNPIDHTIARPYESPWLLFDWGPGRRLTATMPPGKFASACSLVPGRYTFVATRVSRDPRGGQDSLGTTGTITVQ